MSLANFFESEALPSYRDVPVSEWDCVTIWKFNHF